MKVNALSAFGRLSYGAHLALYPLIGGTVYFLGSTYQRNSAIKAKQQEIDSMPDYKPVDPDDFQPFSAIPFHNNVELRYRYANTKMHGYVDRNNHMNVQDYVYKTYHDVYDHDNRKQYMYNWVSVVPSQDVAREALAQ